MTGTLPLTLCFAKMNYIGPSVAVAPHNDYVPSYWFEANMKNDEDRPARFTTTGEKGMR